MTNPDDPAFPEFRGPTNVYDNPSGHWTIGLTKREWFAGRVIAPLINSKLQEILCNFSASTEWNDGKRNETEIMKKAIKDSREQITFFACLFADALIAELNK